MNSETNRALAEIAKDSRNALQIGKAAEHLVCADGGAAVNIPKVDGGFKALLADPPWSYSVFSEKGKARSAEAHYSTMSLSDIAALPVANVVAKDAHLFLWITGPCLVQGQHLSIMAAWGFRPSSLVFVWIKSKVGTVNQACSFVDHHAFSKGMGHTSRQNAECVVLGRRGSPKRLTKAMHQLIVSPKREHSRKPDEIYDRIQEYCDGPYLELFARQSRLGWVTWGDQKDLFDQPAHQEAASRLKLHEGQTTPLEAYIAAQN